MRSTTLFTILLFISVTSVSQTLNTNGNWNTATNWTPASVPSGTGTNVTLAANPTLNTGANNTIGNVTANNNVTLAVNSGATLTLGSSALFGGGTKKSLTFTNNGTLQVAGILEIWGDLIVSNNLALQITGSGQLIVHGNITMNNNAGITVSGTGTLTVGGNVVGGNNATITTTGSGTIGITGTLSLGNGGVISGPAGSVSVGGTCTCTGCSTQCTSSTLPVTLTSFNAALVGASVNLNWVTSSELNFNYFDLERGTSGKDFSPIARIDGHGTTQETNFYSFEDKDPLVGYNYYRLKSVDFDGYTEYFSVISVDFSNEKQFYIYPNPTDGESITVKINFHTDEQSTVLIFDNLGVIKGRYDFNEAGAATIKFPSQLSAGIYYARFSSPSLSRVVRFVVK